MAENNQHSANNVSEFNRFLNNNSSFIHEKYDQFFQAALPISALRSEENMEKCLKFIYEIFSFQKYESNPKLNNTLRKGLSANVESFVQETQVASPKLQFNRDSSVRLLKYCIENNEMFAVHYDRKNPKKKNQAQLEEHNQPQKQQMEPANVEKPASNPKIESQQPKEEEQQPEVSPEAPNPPSEVKDSSVHEQKQLVLDEMRCSNEFQNSPPIQPRQENIQLIHKQLRSVFQFYCKQQQNVTPNSTFDIINHKCQTMNLGKFLYFAVASNIAQSREKAYSEARLDKKAVIAIFKRFAEGQREIDLKVFLAIMDDLHKNDDTLFTRMGLGEQGSKGKSKLIENFKYFNLPFNTRDQTGREKSPHGRIFVPKLTTHSGKIEQSLREQLILRKERPNYESNVKIKAESKTIFRNKAQSRAAYTGEEPKEVTKFSLKQGETNEEMDESQNLKFLSKLITHEENDEIFLKDYHLPIKKSAQSNKEKQKFDQSVRYAKEQDLTSMDRSFGKNPGDYTSRPARETLILPLIKQKRNQGILTERRSLGTDKNVGYKF